jgi:hypothetical protein
MTRTMVLVPSGKRMLIDEVDTQGQRGQVAMSQTYEMEDWMAS